jgi:hypothetical protein
MVLADSGATDVDDGSHPLQTRHSGSKLPGPDTPPLVLVQVVVCADNSAAQLDHKVRLNHE